MFIIQANVQVSVASILCFISVFHIKFFSEGSVFEKDVLYISTTAMTRIE